LTAATPGRRARLIDATVHVEVGLVRVVGQ
jgi:hypothetical protein